MSDDSNSVGDEPLDDEPAASIDDVDVVHALRSALKPPDPQPHRIQRGVQKRIRDETRGRFFADGWSTAAAPRATFLVTSVLMLLFVIAAYALLSPRGVEPLTPPPSAPAPR